MKTSRSAEAYLESAEPFRTQFVDYQDNPITELNLGTVYYSDTSAAQAASCYLKRISGPLTAQTEGVNLKAATSDGSLNGASVSVQGSLQSSSVTRIPVFVTMRPGYFPGEQSVYLVADHGVNQVTVRVLWSYRQSQDESTQQTGGSTPLYGTVTTPYGTYYTTDPNLAGQYVANPTISGGVVTGG